MIGEFSKDLLRTIVAEFDNLSEREKMAGGVTDRTLARVLAVQLNIQPSFVDHPDFHGSEARIKLLNELKELKDADLLKMRTVTGAGWFAPTMDGRELTDQWEREENSPAFNGQRLLRYLYDQQQDEDEISRREGMVEGISVADVCKSLGISPVTYARATKWAIRQRYASLRASINSTIEDGDIYITVEGMIAVENDFKTDQPVSGTTINIHDSQVYGNILAAGRDAMVITSPALTENAEELRSLLAKIQDAAETLPEDDDDRHDALQEIESLQREFSKDAPAPGRLERSLNLIGSISSISTLAGPQLARLLELAQQLPAL